MSGLTCKLTPAPAASPTARPNSPATPVPSRGCGEGSGDVAGDSHERLSKRLELLGGGNRRGVEQRLQQQSVDGGDQQRGERVERLGGDRDPFLSEIDDGAHAPALLGVVGGEPLTQLARAPRLQHRLQKRGELPLGVREFLQCGSGTGRHARQRGLVGVALCGAGDAVGPFQKGLEHRPVQELVARAEVVVHRRHVRPRRRRQVTHAGPCVAPLAHQLLGGVQQGCLGLLGHVQTIVSNKRLFENLGRTGSVAAVPGLRVDYEHHGRSYARHRRADPRIAARIHAALGDARTVVNVGAGAGSYEPDDRWVLAVEPSSTMRAQRSPGAAPAIAASAEALPLDDDCVDAAMACVTVHHWGSLAAGLAELRRVAREKVVVFTFELEHLPAWQLEFLHEGLERERARFPALDDIAAALGERTRIERIPTPGDCEDGFFEAFWRRPEALLDPEIRASQSISGAARARRGGAHGETARRRAGVGRVGCRARSPARAPGVRRGPAPGDLRSSLSRERPTGLRSPGSWRAGAGVA